MLQCFTTTRKSENVDFIAQKGTLAWFNQTSTLENYQNTIENRDSTRDIEISRPDSVRRSLGDGRLRQSYGYRGARLFAKSHHIVCQCSWNEREAVKLRNCVETHGVLS